MVLLDLGLPDSVGLDTLRRLYARAPSVPLLIVLSILADEEIAVQAVQLGAQDYLIKGVVDAGGLVRSVRYARERHRSEEALRRAQAQLENRVRERTAQLARAVDDLQAQVDERRRAEEALRDSQGLLLQAQKLESIGRLAGGVAHDFNNMLMVIMSYSEILTRTLPSGDPMAADVEQIKMAAERGARLTRQLLLFARRGVVEPRLLDLRELSQGLSQLLRRLIGEDIELVVRSGQGLWPVRADVGQLEQVMVNLAVNARDAMPRGGRLTIETENVMVPPQPQGGQLPPGQYVRLTVSDTGTGMSEETRAHLFEPFFTTKGMGQGTGLGLATCHGVVRQCNGHIHCTSALGEGSTFVIYLPRGEGRPHPAEIVDESPAPGGQETVMVVEDDAPVRNIAVRALRGRGYDVLEASNGIEALGTIERGRRRIDLLVTDMVMPQMGGVDLARRLRALQPALQVLFTSGYADDGGAHMGEIDGAKFLEKPFTGSILARQVRELLGHGQ
jgi:signal transduction histidine kinase